jgi:large subunit ribosomal protein L25
MEVPSLKAERREALGTREARRFRAAGRLPGIVYGHGETPEAFLVSSHDLSVHLHHGVRMLDLQMDGKQTHCLIKEVQYDHLGKDPIHIDLTRVDLEERVTVKVAVVLRGTPKGADEGGVLDQLINELEVECPVTEIPETLRATVNHLGVGDTMLVKDVETPPDVRVLNDMEDRVAQVRVPAAAAEPTETTEEEGAAEPERIGRVAEDPKADSDSK